MWTSKAIFCQLLSIIQLHSKFKKSSVDKTTPWSRSTPILSVAALDPPQSIIRCYGSPNIVPGAQETYHQKAMAPKYIAVPENHTVIHTPFLQFLTLTMQVYIRLSASEHNNIVTHAIKDNVYLKASNRMTWKPKLSPPNELLNHILKPPNDLRHHQTRLKSSPNPIKDPPPTDDAFSNRTPRRLETPQRLIINL